MALYSQDASLDRQQSNIVLAALREDDAYKPKERKAVLSVALEVLDSVERGYRFVSSEAEPEKPMDFYRYAWICHHFGLESYTPEFQKRVQKCRETIQTAMDSDVCEISGIPEEELQETVDFFERIDEGIHSDMRKHQRTKVGY